MNGRSDSLQGICPVKPQVSAMTLTSDADLIKRDRTWVISSVDKELMSFGRFIGESGL